ncbi:hypothetical protein IW148_004973 [Coemansia sp. RSA 1199]|nr:hypothetical protein IW148_004973 [Coemansia sp. RSA 1199]
MSNLEPVPDELKHIQPYIQRGHEVVRADPIVSYFCKYYAAQLSIAKQGSSPSAQSYLLNLLDTLETEKAQLQGSDAMTDDTTACAHCTQFALRIFAKADTEDREGRATKATARNFIVSSQFMQVVAAFGELDEGVKEKIRYAKWRAAEILKAMREGREPVPPSGESEGDVMGWPSPPQGQSPSQLGQQGPPSQLGPQGLQSPQIQQGPLSQPGQPQWPDTSYQTSQPQAPSFTPSHHTPDILPSVPHTNLHSSGAPNQASISREMSHGAATFIPVPAASLPAANDTGDFVLDPGDAKIAQKHARWAISALEYDDVNTAIDNLQKAIQVLRPYKS